MCFAPQRLVHFSTIATSKLLPQPLEVFCTFWLANVLRATAACDFSTSWTLKIGPYHECVLSHFDLQMCFAPQRRAIFDRIGTSKMAPTLRCFGHFDLQMCFAPQRRAIFHLSAEHLPPHPPLYRGYFSNIRNHESLKKHSDSRRR